MLNSIFPIPGYRREWWAIYMCYLGLQEYRKDGEIEMEKGGQRRSQRRTKLRLRCVDHTPLERRIFQLCVLILADMEEKAGKFWFKKRNRNGLEECGYDQAPRKQGEHNRSNTTYGAGVESPRETESQRAPRLRHPEVWFLCSNYLLDFERVISPLQASVSFTAKWSSWTWLSQGPDFFWLSRSQPSLRLLLSLKAPDVTASRPFPPLACLLSKKQTFCAFSVKQIQASFGSLILPKAQNPWGPQTPGRIPSFIALSHLPPKLVPYP